jgi:4-aminobutyrate aminotransferase-like enzyme/Ser/Thr protein kinase RdoA (MazF antagonist)
MVLVTSHKPVFSKSELRRLGEEHFGLTGSMRMLPGEHDLNVLFSSGKGGSLLKISHTDESAAILDFQHRALEWIAKRDPDLRMQRIGPSVDGSDLVTVRAADGTEHLTRVLTWIPGKVMAEISPHTPELLRSLGEVCGRIDRALESFVHPAAQRDLKWDLTRPLWVRDHLDTIVDAKRLAMIEASLERFSNDVVPVLGTLRRSIIHNDANDWNVIVGPGHPFERTVSGLVDFGDMLETATVGELAIACTYAMQGKADPLGAAALVVQGYHDAYPLTEDELAVVYPLICTRLAVSLVNSAIQAKAKPGDPYQTISEAGVRDTLSRLQEVHPRLAHYTFRNAAGLEPCRHSTAVVEWLEEHSEEFGPILDIEDYDSIEPLDLSIGSPLVENPGEPEDVPAFSRKLAERVGLAGAAVGIGYYDEARILYVGDAYSAEGNDREVPRTVHIGLDLFVDAGTPVLAPLPGVVESVRDNAGARDYGPTVILRHEAWSGLTFYTLYGHLGREVIGRLRPGSRLERGDRIGVTGDWKVNGGWPPHPHFQIITDLLDRDGEFPGVARSDQRVLWKSLSPDPNLIARFPEERLTIPHLTSAQITTSRRAHIGPSLSISYHRPLTIVRGWKQYLYDDDGLRYLDAVNNVPHVGHSHPAVVRAVREQMAVLNTNTRYLHERLVEYAERLTATLPEPLQVCYFTNSGSEANELAIRLARVATGRRGMVVVDVGYHGNTTTLIDVSPYKHDGPGGSGPPPWVRKVPMPDPYRGLWRGDDPDAGTKYGAAVAEAIGALERNGELVAAFLSESILSCGGQVVCPDGFLREAYARTRAAGGVCIADEVQAGLGRVGSHMWAFETQGVIPDIVTMGKPIGNGHPLGAVVTTREIADAFANGMEYFNTFGGNTVSCAAGLAVLDVMERECLQENARIVGDLLLDGLRQLVHKYPVAGDARGIGLFVGLELVVGAGNDGPIPAPDQATYVANRMRDRGILVSTDGPDRNVIKIKPPLCFSHANADHLIEALDQILQEDYLRHPSL